MLCEACYLQEADLNIGLQLLCTDCAVDHAWERFLDALKAEQPPRKPRVRRYEGSKGLAL